MTQSSPVPFSSVDSGIAAIVLDRRGRVLACNGGGNHQWEQWLTRSRDKQFWEVLPVKKYREAVRQFFLALPADETSKEAHCCVFAAKVTRGVTSEVLLSLKTLVLNEQAIFLGTLSSPDRWQGPPATRVSTVSASELRTTSTLVHELRNSLNLILFSVSMLERCNQQWPDIKRREHLQALHADVKQTVDFLERLLTFDRDWTAAAELQEVLVDPARVCSGVIEKLHRCLEPLCEIRLVQSHPLVVYLDEQLLHSILLNLLLNAIKYSPQKSTINLRLSPRPEGLAIEVEDEGYGLGDADPERLFEPFFRGGNSVEQVGSGLGLTIVKCFVELMGGEISVRSKADQGTAFTVVLPCRYQEPGPNSIPRAVLGSAAE